LSKNIVHKYLNYFPWPKISNRGSGNQGSIVVFFIAKDRSKKFELLFMAKKSHGAGNRSMLPFLLPNIFQNYLNYVSWPKIATRERGSIVPFFVAKDRSKIFELCFMIKTAPVRAWDCCSVA